jgi:hypothetical protein
MQHFWRAKTRKLFISPVDLHLHFYPMCAEAAAPVYTIFAFLVYDRDIYISFVGYTLVTSIRVTLSTTRWCSRFAGRLGANPVSSAWKMSCPMVGIRRIAVVAEEG